MYVNVAHFNPLLYVWLKVTVTLPYTTDQQWETQQCGNIWCWWEDFDTGSRYLGLGLVITSHRILWDVITYPCPRYLLLMPKSSYTAAKIHWVFHAGWFPMCVWCNFSQHKPYCSTVWNMIKIEISNCLQMNWGICHQWISIQWKFDGKIGW